MFYSTCSWHTQFTDFAFFFFRWAFIRALDRARRRQTTTVRIILDHFHQFRHLAFLPGRPHHGMRLWLRISMSKRAAPLHLCPWKSRVSRGRAPFSCDPPSWEADARRQAATAPRRAPKSWLIRVRLLEPAPPAWAPELVCGRDVALRARTHTHRRMYMHARTHTRTHTRVSLSSYPSIA